MWPKKYMLHWSISKTLFRWWINTVRNSHKKKVNFWSLCLINKTTIMLFCTAYNDGTRKVLMSLTGTIPIVFKGNALTFYMRGNFRHVHTTKHFTSVYKYSHCIWRYVRCELQHPHTCVAWGELPSVGPHLLCQAHVGDDDPAGKLRLQQWWHPTAILAGVEAGEQRMQEFDSYA